MVSPGCPRLIFASIACTLGACALGPDFKQPDPPAVSGYLPGGARTTEGGAGVARQRFDERIDVPAEWWALFDSPRLNDLVRGAVARSPTLVAAQAALRQSEDSLKAGYGVFYPQVGASVVAARQNSLAIVNRAPVATGLYNLGTVSASVSYALDLFGGQRRTVEALGAKVDLQRADYLAAYLALTANVANTVIARAGYRAQRDALREMIAMQADQIRLATVQYEAGTAPYAPVLALRSQRASNRATLAALEQRIDQSEHLLAQLGGQAPAEASLPAIALDELTLPLELPQTLPSTLARRRPDILAAEAVLHAASAQIGVATADLFPQLTLGGVAGSSHGVIADLLQSGTRFWSLQASLAASIFSGGSQWYARSAAIDAYDQALATYRETVLEALTQVADTLRALEHDTDVQKAQVDAEVAAASNLELVRANYEAGTAGYLDLLNADSQLRQARLARFAATAQRLQDTVALYTALGGGWWGASDASVPAAALPH
ncbi:MAG TPA: efflux transporter outer membrane subunit [Burkholderiaceae bacterium]|nr:efflux transporter outer membrane subunit [Burkholderiaceae bacterium]